MTNYSTVEIPLNRISKQNRVMNREYFVLILNFFSCFLIAFILCVKILFEKKNPGFTGVFHDNPSGVLNP